jgi:hypothetical protein
MSDAPALSERDRQVLTDLVIEHAWLLDHGHWHSVADLYLDDGSMIMGDQTLRGRDALLAWADARADKSDRHTHHQCSNIRLQGGADGEATGTVMLVLHSCEGGSAPRIEFVGEYRDQYRRDTAGRWRFAQRQLHPLRSPALAERNPVP